MVADIAYTSVGNSAPISPTLDINYYRQRFYVSTVVVVVVVPRQEAEGTGRCENDRSLLWGTGEGRETSWRQ